MAVRPPRVGIAGWRPGAVGAVARLHGEWYAKHWGFGAAFECRVARGLADLVERGDPARDGFWIAADGPAVVGSVAMDGTDAAGEGARLRFFLVDEARQGERIGARLIDAALAFCDRAGHRRVFLWTFAGLDAARSLYERRGFRIVAEHPDTQWGTRVMEQKFVRECSHTGELRREEAETRGAKGRAAGEYTVIREDFEPTRNVADRPRSRISTAG